MFFTINPNYHSMIMRKRRKRNTYKKKENKENHNHSFLPSPPLHPVTQHEPEGTVHDLRRPTGDRFLGQECGRACRSGRGNSNVTVLEGEWGVKGRVASKTHDNVERQPTGSLLGHNEAGRFGDFIGEARMWPVALIKIRCTCIIRYV